MANRVPCYQLQQVVQCPCVHINSSIWQYLADAIKLYAEYYHLFLWLFVEYFFDKLI